MKKLIHAIIFISSLIFGLSANAQQFSQNDYKDFIQNLGDSIVNISSSSHSEKKKVKTLVNLIDKSIDSKWISRFVLGKHYRSFSKDQYNQFLNLYRQFMINSYGQKFLYYRGSNFEVGDVKFQKIFYQIDSKFYTVGSPHPVLVSFRAKKSKGSIIVIDFIAEGVSLLESQRSELDSIISNKGIERFLEELEVKSKNYGNSPTPS